MSFLRPGVIKQHNRTKPNLFQPLRAIAIFSEMMFVIYIDKNIIRQYFMVYSYMRLTLLSLVCFLQVMSKVSSKSMTSCLILIFMSTTCQFWVVPDRSCRRQQPRVLHTVDSSSLSTSHYIELFFHICRNPICLHKSTHVHAQHQQICIPAKSTYILIYFMMIKDTKDALIADCGSCIQLVLEQKCMILIVENYM